MLVKIKYMNKEMLAKFLSNEFNINKKKSKEYIDFIFKEISLSLQRGECVKIANFGQFSTRISRAKANNLKNSMYFIAPKLHFLPKFRPSKSLKRVING